MQQGIDTEAQIQSDLSRAANIVKQTSELVASLEQRYGRSTLRHSSSHAIVHNMQHNMEHCRRTLVQLALSHWVENNFVFPTSSSSSSSSSSLPLADTSRRRRHHNDTTTTPTTMAAAAAAAAENQLRRQSWQRLPRKLFLQIINEYLKELHLDPLKQSDPLWTQWFLRDCLALDDADQAHSREIQLQDNRSLEAFQQTLEQLLVKVKEQREKNVAACPPPPSAAKKQKTAAAPAAAAVV